MFQEVLGNPANYNGAVLCPTSCATYCSSSCVGCVSREIPTVEIRVADRMEILAVVRDETA
jgi:hypothetical protein